MVKTWSDDDPKAALMARKRTLIVDAALQAFLEHGYAESSVNKIAEVAGVSIKTLYRHFETKDELFSAVMQVACSRHAEPEGDNPIAMAQEIDPAWYAVPPHIALVRVGEDYLHHILSKEQLAIYRVITRDAHRFPELRRRYQLEVVGHRAQVLANYIERWQSTMGWSIADKYAVTAAFSGLLKALIFDDAVQGGPIPDDEEMSRCARTAAACLLNLLAAGLL